MDLPKVCVSYSHDDYDFFEQVKKDLDLLSKNQVISFWADHMIKAGADWDEEIKEKFNDGDIFILLISRSFITSRYINEIETVIIKRKRLTGSVVIPIFISPAMLDFHEWILKTQGLPMKEGKPVYINGVSEGERQELYTQIGTNIKDIAVKFQEKNSKAMHVLFGTTNNLMISKEQERVLSRIDSLKQQHSHWNFKLFDFLNSNCSYEPKALQNNFTETLNNKRMCIILGDPTDDFFQWQFEVIRERLSETQTKFLFFVDKEKLKKSNENEFTTRFIQFFNNLDYSRIQYHPFSTSEEVVEILKEELNILFPEPSEILGSANPNHVILCLEPQTDGNDVFRLEIKQRIEQKSFSVHNIIEGSDQEADNKLLSKSIGIILYHGKAEIRWLETIQMLLSKTFAIRQIFPRLTILSDPDKGPSKETKLELFLSHELRTNEEQNIDEIKKKVILVGSENLRKNENEKLNEAINWFLGELESRDSA